MGECLEVFQRACWACSGGKLPGGEEYCPLPVPFPKCELRTIYQQYQDRKREPPAWEEAWKLLRRPLPEAPPFPGEEGDYLKPPPPPPQEWPENPDLPPVCVFMPVRDRAWVLDLVLEPLAKLQWPEAKLFFYFLVNDSEDESEALLRGFLLGRRGKIEVWNRGLERDVRYDLAVRKRLYGPLADLRNRGLEFVRSLGPEWGMLSHDADVIGFPEMLRRFHARGRDAIALTISNVQPATDLRLSATNASFLGKTENRDWITPKPWTPGVCEVRWTGVVMWLSAAAVNCGAQYAGSEVGEDLPFCQGLRERGFRLYQDGDMVGTHLIDREDLDRYHRGEYWRPPWGPHYATLAARKTPLQQQLQLYRKPPIIVLSGVDWKHTGGGQRPRLLARALARQGYPVFHCGGEEKPTWEWEDGVCCFSTEWLPSLAEEFEQPGLWLTSFPLFDPEPFQQRGWTLAYDLIDDWNGFAREDQVMPGFLEAERRLLPQARFVTCSATSLLRRAERLGARQMFLLPNATEEGTIPAVSRKLVRGDAATLVYCGSLGGNWLDWKILCRLADAHPEWSVNLIGARHRWDGLRWGREHPGFYDHDEVPFEEIRGLLAQADVGLIPFRGKLCRSVDPIKYYDYLAAGLPTVATTILTELKGRPYVYLAPPSHLERAVRRALRGGKLTEAQRRAALEGQTWDDRAGELLRIWGRP